MGRVVVAAVFVVVLVVVLVAGASDALGRANVVRVKVTPKSIKAGDSVLITAGVSSAGVLCSGTIGRGSKSIKLTSRKASKGVVSWKQKIPASAPGGRWTVRVSCTHAGSATAYLSVTANDFAISANLGSLAIEQGASGTSTISIAFRSGSAQSISLSASGAPTEATVSFNSSSVAVNSYDTLASATMTVNVRASAASGSYPITVKGAGIGATHTTIITLNVLIPAKVVAVKSGLSSRTGCTGCDTYLSYGLVLQNTSPDEDALRVTLTLNFLDASGLIVHAATVYGVGPVPAGATYYFGGYYSDYKPATPVQVQLASAQVARSQKKAIGGLPPVASVSVTDSSGSAHVLGEFTNPYTWTIPDYVDVTAVCFDAAGNVIGGGSGNPNASVTPGGRTGFDIPIRSLSASQIASAQVSVAPSPTS
jgi:hypothetical protein